MSEKRRLKVGHVTYSFKNAGVERELLDVVNYGDRDRFQHVILCLTEADAFAEKLVSPTCTLIEFHKKAGNDWRLPRRIASVAREHRLDVLHARQWPALVETAVAARLAGIRATIYSVHGKTLQDLQGLNFKRRWVQRLVVRLYSETMTLNHRMRADMAHEYGLPEGNIRLIPSGVDVESYHPYEGRRALREAFGLPTDQFIIGNVARLDPVKNHDVILRAVRRVLEQGERPFVLFVGDGPRWSILEQEIASLGLTGTVRLFGYSDRVPELLNCMDLYVQSSLYEGHSIAIMEAMACGLPVLATEVGGTPDLLREGQEGFFFQSGDDRTLASLIMRLKKNSSLRSAMAERARQHVVERFSVQVMVKEYERMYVEVETAVNCCIEK